MDVEDIFCSRAFSVSSGFEYSNGCDGSGANCEWIHKPLRDYIQFTDVTGNRGNNPNCNTAFHTPDDTYVQVACKYLFFEFS
jgi:hypothetical protein